jgi:uncharacterized protein YegL
MNALPVPAGAVLIAALVDRSGSMARYRTEMEDGLNSFMREQAELPGAAGVMLAQFDDQYEVVWEMTPIGTVPDYRLVPRGGTALLDSIGTFIGDINTQLAQEDTYRPVICVITTDGHENASKEWTRAAVKEWINHQREVYKWEFIFLGANLDAVLEGESFGISKQFALTFDATRARASYRLLSRQVAQLRAGNTSGFSEADRRKALGR